MKKSYLLVTTIIAISLFVFSISVYADEIRKDDSFYPNDRSFDVSRSLKDFYPEANAPLRLRSSGTSTNSILDERSV